MTGFFIQAIGIGIGYVFLDGEMGEPRIYKVAANSVLEGMMTSEMNSETLEEISRFMTENKAAYEDKGLILYGNIPGLAYYLDKAPAIYTTWADLNTNPLARLEAELGELTTALQEGEGDKPLVILTPKLAAYLSGSQEAMDWWGTDGAECRQDKKLGAIEAFINANGYRQVFVNEAFVVYE